MIPVLSAEQTRIADNWTIEHEPIASLDLMDRAAGLHRMDQRALWTLHQIQDPLRRRE